MEPRSPCGTRRVLAVCSAFWLVLAGSAPATRADDLKVGDSAPDFMLIGSDEKLHALATYRGKTGVVLAWFPKAFTPG